MRLSISIQFFVIGCQEYKRRKCIDLGGGSFIPNGLHGPCAGIHCNCFVEWTVSSFDFQQISDSSITNKQSHVDRNADITISCAAVGDRCDQSPVICVSSCCLISLCKCVLYLISLLNEWIVRLTRK